MGLVRAQLAEDESLSDRLAMLAAVDQQLSDSYSAIERRPLPSAVTKLLTDSQISDEGKQKAEVTAFPRWRRSQQQLQRHAGMAAALALDVRDNLSRTWSNTNTASPASRKV